MASAFAVRESESGAPRTFESTPTAGSDGFPDRGPSGSRPIWRRMSTTRSVHLRSRSINRGDPRREQPPLQRPPPPRPHADADEPGGQPPRKRDMNEQPHDPWRLDFAAVAEGALS